MSGTGATNSAFKDCYADFTDGILVIGNRAIQRRWLLKDNYLQALDLEDKCGGKIYTLYNITEKSSGRAKTTFKDQTAPLVNGSIDALHISLVAEINGAESVYNFAIAPEANFILQNARHGQKFFPSTGSDNENSAKSLDGIELAEMKNEEEKAAFDICRIENWMSVNVNKLLFTANLKDATDRADNLLSWDEFRVSRSEGFTGTGCLFALMDPLSGEGLILLKHAPLPHARPLTEKNDLEVTLSELKLYDFAGGSYQNSYDWTVIPFTGGEPGITKAVQKERTILHPYNPECDGLFISNTWGDRSQDGAITNDFLKKEVATAIEMGLDVCQIDDGWQQGVSANSVNAAAEGGVWEGFHAADADFWTPNRKRLPEGLEPVIKQANDNGIGIGLWYAPDSSHDFTNWEKDADTILELWRRYGVLHFKADSVKAKTKSGETNLKKMFKKIADESSGKILIDLDVTSGIRPGYFGAPDVGAIFVENRYSDHASYWPHATFRNLWQLSRILPPSILRMEILNLARNTDKYPETPLAPANYNSEYVFATIMVSSPLMWCELSNLGAKQKNEMAKILPLWKKYRHELHTSTVYPIGQKPCGASWSGYFVEGAEYCHLLAFREITRRDNFSFDLPVELENNADIEQISGVGSINIDQAVIQVTLPETMTYGWWRIKK